jgi:hypothetical protein
MESGIKLDFTQVLESFLEILGNLFKIVPDTIIGVILGSLITLLGIYLQNRGAEKRLKIELDNKSLENKKEKEYQFKKEIYSLIISDIEKFKNYAFCLSGIDLSQNNFNNLDFKSSNIKLIANKDTLDIYSKINSYMIEKILYLMTLKLSLDDVKNTIDLNNSFIDKYRKEQDNELLRMKEHNLQNFHDEILWNTIQKNYNFTVDQIEKFSNNNDILFKKQIELHGNYLVEANNIVRNMLEMEIDLIKVLRNELNISTDLGEYKTILENQFIKNENHINDFSNNLLSNMN